jgi:hypothetical protein
VIPHDDENAAHNLGVTSAGQCAHNPMGISGFAPGPLHPPPGQWRPVSIHDRGILFAHATQNLP